MAASDIAVRGPGTFRGNQRLLLLEYGTDCSQSDDAAVGEARAGPERAATALRKPEKKTKQGTALREKFPLSSTSNVVERAKKKFPSLSVSLP